MDEESRVRRSPRRGFWSERAQWWAFVPWLGDRDSLLRRRLHGLGFYFMNVDGVEVRFGDGEQVKRS